jgi:ATP-binding cassette, subfamily F, member 3
LDEPTNHLDMESVESLVEACEQFSGTVLLVSHDEDLLRALATRLVVFDGDRTFVFDGTYDEFLERVGWVEEAALSK